MLGHLAQISEEVDQKFEQTEDIDVLSQYLSDAGIEVKNNNVIDRIRRGLKWGADKFGSEIIAKMMAILNGMLGNFSWSKK